MKSWLASLAVLGLASCQQPAAGPQVPEGSLEASGADAARLQTLAGKACECTRTSGEEWWEPWPYKDSAVATKPPGKCWEEFAAALKPYAYNVAPVAACGPGSDTNGIELGPRREFHVQLHLGFGTCTAAQFEKAKVEYEAMSKRPGCG